MPGVLHRHSGGLALPPKHHCSVCSGSLLLHVTYRVCTQCGHEDGPGAIGALSGAPPAGALHVAPSGGVQFHLDDGAA